jgi:hypothetical protein
MKRTICLTPFLVVMTLAACTVDAPVSRSESSQSVQASSLVQPTQPPRRTQLAKGTLPPVHTDADLCFTVYGSCGFAFCDGDWNDTQNISEVCCSNGGCLTDNYWVCGGPCEPETSSCSCSSL